MTNQEIIDKHLKAFYEVHNEKIPMNLNVYIHKIIQEAIYYEKIYNIKK